MASQSPPKKNTAFSFEIGLFSQADSTTLKSGPTLAAGDFKFSLDGSAPASITNTPTASGTVVTVALIAAEMNGDRVHIVWQDAAGAEWVSGWMDLFTTAATQDEISARIPTALDANGFMKADVEDWKGATAPANTGDAFARLGAPAGASNAADVAAVKVDTAQIASRVTAAVATATALAAVQSDTDDIQTRLPAALVGGRMDASIGALVNSIITNLAFAPSALDSAALATDAGQEIADRLLARNIAGGSDGGVTVFAMLAAMGMDFSVVAGVLTVKSPIDGVTVVYTRTLSRTAGLDAITGSS